MESKTNQGSQEQSVSVQRTTPKYCEYCNGTGADAKATAEMRKKETSATGYIRCWNCNGNGLNPLHFFRFSNGN